jgi:tetratricopeptide (TPR) repeat protein
MAAQSPFGSPSFSQVAKSLVALHRLIKDGKDDSAEAESVRDGLDLPLKALNTAEKERARWLSEDLYSVSEPPPGTVLTPMNAQSQEQFNAALEARQSGEWDRALGLLRRLREYISPSLLSYLRGSIWLEADNADVAAAFFGHAAETNSANASYRALYMHALAESNPDAARKLAREVLEDDEKYAPVVVGRAAEIRFNEARTTSDADSTRLARKLISLLERNMTRIENDENTISRASAYAMTVGVLGMCFEFIGDAGAAVLYYSRGLEANPKNDGLLVARGILLYGASPRAVSDFEQAVELGSPIIWPYLFLAHHYLITSQFDRCRAMCESGLKMRGSDAGKSQLEEWRAIAEAELGFPPELVRIAFDSAIRLDPSNDLAKRNRASFEAALAALRTPHHVTWEQKPVAVLRQLGLAERRYSSAA